MPPKQKSTAEDLIEALLDPRVVDAISKALSPSIALSIDEVLGKRLEGLVTSVRDLKGEVTRLNKQCDEVHKENTTLKQQIIIQDRRLDDLETYSRSDNLIIRGLPEQSAAERATGGAALDDHATLDNHTSVESTVIAFVKDSLGIDLLPRDVSIAHRIKAGPKDLARPIVVRFTSRKVRNLVYSSKKKLKDCGHRVFISEHLTKAASDLFFEARKLVRDKRLSAAWTQNGQIFVKASSDPNIRAVIAKSRSDLNIRS
jgi:hypothetical protein